MSRSVVAAVLGVAILSLSASAVEPLRPVYQVGDQLRLLFCEYCVTGPGVAKPNRRTLVCTYSTRPVAMVYTSTLTPSVVRLIKKLDEATANHAQDRMGSYVVLFCDSVERAEELQALAQKEKIQNTVLSLVVINEDERTASNHAKLGA